MYLFVCHFVYYQMINPLHPMPFLWLVSPYTRSVARKETLDVHQKNWVCHIYCQINAKKINKNEACLLGINMLV